MADGIILRQSKRRIYALQTGRNVNMCDGEGYSIEEAHKLFAAEYNGGVWELLEKDDRTEEESAKMLHMAHASCAHWLKAGTEVNHQRGEWMISRVNTVLGYPEAALRHAKSCMKLTEQHAEEMDDFDRAFALEAMARAFALAGERETALEYFGKAEEAGKAITDAENREIFEGDLNGGNWFGIH